MILECAVVLIVGSAQRLSIALNCTVSYRTGKVDETAAVATVTTRLFSARVQQMTTVAEEPGAALAERRRAGGFEHARRAAIATPAVGRLDRPTFVTTTPGATGRRPSLSSIIGLTATNYRRS